MSLNLRLKKCEIDFQKICDVELQRRKKILEEELQQKTDLANMSSFVIFSDIFRILRQPTKKLQAKNLLRRKRLRRKMRERFFLEESLLEDELQRKNQISSSNKELHKEKEMIHLFHHNRMIAKKPPQEDLETYRKLKTN